MALCGIYKITNPVNGLFYIGRSNNIERRWKEHKRSLEKGVHTVDAFQYDYDFISSDLVFEILEECEEKDLVVLEDQYIRELDPHYNYQHYKSPREFIIREIRFSQNLKKEMERRGFDPKKVNVYPLREVFDEDAEVDFISRYSSVGLPVFKSMEELWGSLYVTIIKKPLHSFVEPHLAVVDFDEVLKNEFGECEYSFVFRGMPDCYGFGGGKLSD